MPWCSTGVSGRDGSPSGAWSPYTQWNLFQILLNQTEIRLYLPCTDWFGIANEQRPGLLFQNQSEHCKYNPISVRFDKNWKIFLLWILPHCSLMDAPNYWEVIDWEISKTRILLLSAGHRVSGVSGVLEAPETLRNIIALLYRIEGFKGEVCVLNWASNMRRETPWSLSQTADVLSFWRPA